MQLATVHDRRNLLLGALSLLGLAAGGARAARAPAPPRRTQEQILQEQAASFLDACFGQHGDVLVGPISLLQREYRLGYGAALDLAARLEEAQVWSVFHDASGMRCARKLVRA
jgi:hypothetical protein